MFKKAITSMILIASGCLLCACIGPAGGGCTAEEPPEFSNVDGEITRQVVFAELGEPSATIERENYRVVVYDYNQFCAGVFFLIYPIPYMAALDQHLTIEYDADGSFRTAQLWPRTDTLEEAIAAYDEHLPERLELEAECSLPLPEATKIDGPVQYKRSYICAEAEKVEADPIHWRWICFAAHGQHGIAQRRMGILLYYHSGELANDERLVAEWEPNPAECEEFTAQSEN